VNPVIPEMIAQMSMKVTANDTAITQAAMSGQLELNAFGPLIAECLLESLEMMTKAITIFEHQCIEGIEVHEDRCRQNLERSSSLVTALVHHIGYDASSEIAKEALQKNTTIEQVLLEKNVLSKTKIKEILNPYQVTKPGIPGK
jgi:aspartate ammonia-lyase